MDVLAGLTLNGKPVAGIPMVNRSTVGRYIISALLGEGRSLLPAQARA